MELTPLEPRRLAQWRRRLHERLGVGVVPGLHEALCRSGRAYAVRAGGRECGYAIQAETSLAADVDAPILAEWLLEPVSARAAKNLLRGVVEQLRARTVIGRTDDPAGFPLLMDMGYPNRMAAPLYVLETPPDWTEERDWRVHATGLDDVQGLQAMYASVPPEEGGIADEKGLLKSLVAWRHYRLVVAGAPAAVAYVVPQGGKYVTVVPIVAEAYRGRGIGRYLAAYAVRRELGEGRIYLAALDAPSEPAVRLVESLGARLAAHVMHFHAPGGVEIL
mgnify:CR=1 FL=1